MQDSCVAAREIKKRLKLRPGSFLGHLLLWYQNYVRVSIPSNRSLLGIERLTEFWYSVSRLQEPMPWGRRGAQHAGRARLEQ